MHHSKSSSWLNSSFILGFLGGAVAALFLTPQTGEQTRKTASKVFEKLQVAFAQGNVDEVTKQIFGEATEEGRRIIAEIQTELQPTLQRIMSEAQNLDKAKFENIVDNSLVKLGEKVKIGGEHIAKLKSYLVDVWTSEEKKIAEAQETLKPKLEA